MSAAPRPLHVGHYVLSGVLGEGAMSTVYLARHRATGRLVALKALRHPMASEEEARTRMRLEARVLGKVRAAHLVDALDTGTLEDGSPYLVLEHLDGHPVSVHLADGPLAIGAAVAIADGVLEALDALHAAGVVHRDVKPANVVLGRSAEGWTPKLIDLGVCLDRQNVTDATRLTAQGTWVGTPCYMAPEQLDGRSLDERTDVYGVGALLYECLVGQPPHVGTTAAQVATRVLADPVIPVDVRRPDCPAPLARLVARALAKSPDERPRDAATLRAELEAVRRRVGLPEARLALAAIDTPRGTQATSPRSTTRSEPARRGRAWRSVAIGAALASSFACGGALAVLSGQPGATYGVPGADVPGAAAPTTTPVLQALEDAIEAPAIAPSPRTSPMRAMVRARPRSAHAKVRPASDPDLAQDASVDLPDGGGAPEPLLPADPTWEELDRAADDPVAADLAPALRN